MTLKRQRVSTVYDKSFCCRGDVAEKSTNLLFFWIVFRIDIHKRTINSDQKSKAEIISALRVRNPKYEPTHVARFERLTVCWH